MIFRPRLLACFAALLGFMISPATALVLDFQFNENADLEGGTDAGPDDLGSKVATLNQIAVGDGTFLGLTVQSAPGNLNSADNGLGVVGGGIARLGVDESIAFSFNRNLTVVGYTLNEVNGTDNTTYTSPTSGGTQTTTSAIVSGLSLPMVAGETFTLSSTAGDGVRVATLTVTFAATGDDTYTLDGNSKNNVLPVLNNDAGAGLSITAITRPAHGVAVISGKNVLYSPATGYVGADSFSYTNKTSGGLTDNRSATLTVIAPGSAAANDRYQVLRNTDDNPLDVLRNDPGTGLSLVSLTSPSHGSASIRSGKVLYAPAANYLGADSFTYTTRDGVNAPATRSVTLDVRRYPNFIMLLADDQGWTGTSVRMDKSRPDSKSDYYRTPRTESFAAESMRFSMGYSSAPNCSPSRYALLTGKTCARLKMTDILGRNNAAVSGKYKLISPGKAVDAIQSSMKTTPEVLKAIAGAGYSAAHFGKWHLGGGGPVAHGFDPDATDGETGNNEGNTGTAPFDPDPKRAYTITDRSLSYLDSKAVAGAPFYLQVSHYAVHDETQTLQTTYNTFNNVPKGTWHTNQYYAGMTADLDINFGRLLDEIDDLGLRNSTYIIYQADNGAPQDQSENYPLRGYKPEVWEGGDRVPTFVRGPGILPDSQCDLPVVGFDVLPTVTELAAGDLTALPVDVDGGSWVAAMRSISAGISPAKINRGGEFVHHAPHYVGPLPWPDDWQLNLKDARPRSSLHDGNYKLVANYEPGTIELYNLASDIGEQANLSEAELAIKWRMWVRLRDYLKLVHAQMPTLDPSYRGTSHGAFVLEAATGPLGDADSDGLNDDWEFRELLTYQFNGRDDPDHDGVSTADELAQGTDPLLPNAYRIDTITQVAANQIQLTYNSTPGSQFVVETSTDLLTWFPAQMATTGNQFQGSVTVITTGPRQFFRVRKL